MNEIIDPSTVEDDSTDSQPSKLREAGTRVKTFLGRHGKTILVGSGVAAGLFIVKSLAERSSAGSSEDDFDLEIDDLDLNEFITE